MISMDYSAFWRTVTQSRLFYIWWHWRGSLPGCMSSPVVLLLLKPRTANQLLHFLFRNSWVTSREGVSYPLFLRQWPKHRYGVWDASVCVYVCVRACVRACVCACYWHGQNHTSAPPKLQGLAAYLAFLLTNPWCLLLFRNSLVIIPFLLCSWRAVYSLRTVVQMLRTVPSIHLVSLNRLSVGCGTTPRRQSGDICRLLFGIRVIYKMLPPHGHCRNIFVYKQLKICISIYFGLI